MYNVSIIIPAYCTTPESVEWLRECIDSALIQDCEVVVYNDGSTESLHKLRKDSHIFIDGSVNAGVSHARNRAAYYATKDMLYPLDGDDRLKPGSISKLLDYWHKYETMPVYSDVAKFGIENVEHYALLDFDCSHILNHVGFSSVNVLHPKEYWKKVGGWEEWLVFYEDGFYNAQLFAQWCGVRCPEPLVEYRQHADQRTKKFDKQSAYFAKLVLDKIRRLDMGCGGGCGKKSSKMLKTSSNAPLMQAIPVDVQALPGEQGGRILAQYVGGKGKGRHYYQGPKTRYMYKVLYGDYIYADPTDVKDPGNAYNSSLLVKVIKTESKAIPQETVSVAAVPAEVAAPQPGPAEPVTEKVTRKPVKAKTRKPV